MASSATPNPRMMKAETRISLQQGWENAQKQFVSENPELTLNLKTIDKYAILQEWRSNYAKKGGEGSEKREKMAKILNNVLTGVELVGGFAAQAASTVFPPAGMCFNAVQFLIAAPQTIRKVYDDLELLFQRVEKFLVQFRIYKKIDDKFGLDEDLIVQTNELLMCFVKICGTATKILGASRIKIGLKAVFFKDDGGVLGDLQTFQQLTEDQQNLTNTVQLFEVLRTQESVNQVLRDTGALGGKMDMLLAASNDEKARLVNKERLKTIERKLFRQPLVDEVRSFTGAIDELLPDTYDVIQKVEGYREWENNHNESPTTLIVSGAPGSGKSCLLDTMKNHLETIRDTAALETAGIYIAVSSFASKRFKNGLSRVSLPEALKDLAFQIASQSTAYAEHLHQQLSTEDSLHTEFDTIKLWSILQFSQFTTTIPSKLYIILDSIEQEFTKFETLLELIKRTPKALGSPQVKFLLAINSHDPASDQLDSISAYKLEADKTKNELIDSYVWYRMKQLNIFQGFDRQARKRRQYIIENLIPPNKDTVRFSTLQEKLTKLDTAIKSGLPRDAVADIIGTRIVDGLVRRFKDLEDSLCDIDMILLRNIVQWLAVQHGGRIKLAILEAAMELAQVKMPIESLSRKVTTDFSKVLALNGDEVCLLPSIDDGKSGSWWPKNDDERCEQSRDGESLITVNISLENATRETLGNIVGCLSENINTGKFDFDQVSSQRRLKLSSDRVTDQLYVLKLCFKLVNEGWDSSTKLLLPCALETIPRLLQELEPDEATLLKSHERKMVGESLVAFLRDPKCFKRNNETFGDFYLLRYNAWAKPMRFWLKSERVLEQLSTANRDWATKYTGDQSAPFDFLTDLAISIGGKWLTDYQSKSYELWVWVDSYLKLVADNKSVPQSETSNNADSEGTDPVTRAQLWVAKHCSVAIDSAKSHLAVGNTCYRLEQFERAIDNYRGAIADTRIRPHALQGLALCYQSLGDMEQVEILHNEMLTAFKDMSHEDLMTDYDWEIRTSYIRYWAEFMTRKDRSREAIGLYEKILDSGKGDYTSHWTLIKLYCTMTGSGRSAINKLGTWSLNMSPTRYEGYTPASSLLELTEQDAYNTILRPLVASVTDEELRTMLLRVIEDATRLAGKTVFNGIHSRLHYLRGSCWKGGATSEHKEQAIHFWEKALETSDSGESPQANMMVKFLSRDILKYKFETLRTKLDSRFDWTTSDKKELSKEMQECYIRMMEYYRSLASIPRGVDGLESLVIALAQLCEDHSTVLKLSRNDMAKCLSVVSNPKADPYDDTQARRLLARIFCCLGDRVNALTAFSLSDKKIIQKQFKDPTYMPTSNEQYSAGFSDPCSGCNKIIYSSDHEGIWWCRFCPNFNLCTACKDIHLTGPPGLGTRNFAVGVHGIELCEATHGEHFMQMVHGKYGVEEIPSDRVRVGWHFDQGGERQGGKVLTVDEWFERLRNLWKLH